MQLQTADKKNIQAIRKNLQLRCRIKDFICTQYLFVTSMDTHQIKKPGCYAGLYHT